MTAHTKPMLIMHRKLPNSVIFSLDSPLYEPRWEGVKVYIAQFAFSKRDICLISNANPNWELDIVELLRPVIEIKRGKMNIALMFPNPITNVMLNTIVNSTDFQLGEVLMANIPENAPERIEKFINALVQRDPVKPIETSEEYMDCFDHNWLGWHNANNKAIQQCEQALKVLADEYNWQFKTTTEQKG